MTREEEIYNAMGDAEWKHIDGTKDIELFDMGFKEGAEWADAHPHPHWISVEDELPKENGRYLFYHTILGVHSSYYYNDLTLDKAFTHWMPLPAPPKKGGVTRISPSDFVKEHYRNKSLGDTEGIKDELDCIGSDGSDPFDEVEKQIESQHKKEEKQ